MIKDDQGENQATSMWCGIVMWEDYDISDMVLVIFDCSLKYVQHIFDVDQYAIDRAFGYMNHMCACIRMYIYIYIYALYIHTYILYK